MRKPTRPLLVLALAAPCLLGAGTVPSLCVRERLARATTFIDASLQKYRP